MKVTVLFTDKTPVMNAEIRGDTRVYTDEDGNAEVNVFSDVTKKSPLVGGNVEVHYKGQTRVEFVEGERNRSKKLRFEDIELPPPPPVTHTVTIESDPEGVASVRPYNVGTHVDIADKTAIQFHQTSLKPGYAFAGWLIDGITSTEKDLELVIEKDIKITVSYVKVGKSFMLTTHVEGIGETRPIVGKGDYPEGHTIEVTAEAAPGWYLHHFEVDGAISETLERVEMSKKRELVIVFRKKHP